MSEKNFADRLIAAVKKKGNPICVGLDPRLDLIPGFLKKKALEAGGTPTKAAAEAILEFNKGIIDAVADIVPVVKPQIAFYELFGHDGVWAYQETLKYAKSKGLITIADAKRNDIGSTAAAYARAFLGEVEMFEDMGQEVVVPMFDADSLTVNAYLGWDGIKPFVEEGAKYGKGIFVLVKTSNPSGADLQDLELKEGGRIYEVMGGLMDSWGADHVGESGYSLVGAVVGATYPAQAAALRKIMPKAIFLVPGYGAQGGGAEDVKPCFNSNGLGAVVNSSRGITFAYQKKDGFSEESYAEAAREAVEDMKKDLESVL